MNMENEEEESTRKRNGKNMTAERDPTDIAGKEEVSVTSSNLLENNNKDLVGNDLSVPVTPLNIQKVLSKGSKIKKKDENKFFENEMDIEENYRRSIEKFRNALDLEVPDGIFAYVKIPGILMIAVILGYLVGRLRLSIFLIFFICQGVYFVFKRKVHKFKRSMKAMVYKESLREKTLNNWESVEWINYMINRTWNVIEPTISKEVFKKVNPILAEKCPPFLSKLRLSEFTLGSAPPHVSGILFFENCDPETIQIDAEVTFIPLETGIDAYFYISKKKKYEWNSKIMLISRLGSAVKGIGLDLPILVKSLSFRGKGRLILKLTKEIPFIKEVEFCFMEPPEIDFTLKPLKTVDLMDVPGLSNWIGTIMNSTIKKMVVNPNSIKVDIKKLEAEKGYPIGVVCVYVFNLNNKGDISCSIEIDVDGRRMYRTTSREGSSIGFYEYFYLIVENTDNLINFNLLGSSLGGTTSLSEGCINLKKLIKKKNLVDNVKMMKRGNLNSLMDTSSHFYNFIPKQAEEVHPTKSAVIKMKILQVEDMQGKNQPRKKVYNSSCMVIVAPKVEPQQKRETSKGFSMDPFKFVAGTVNATATLVGGTLKTAGNVFGNIIPGTTSHAPNLLPSSESTFYIYETKKISDTNSPSFDESFSFFSRDIYKDCICICINNSHEIGESVDLIGKVEIPVKDVFDGSEKWYRLKDAQNGKIKIKFSMKYIDLDRKHDDFKKYEKIVKLKFQKLKTLYESANYYAFLTNREETFMVDSFCAGDLPINREVYIPMLANDDLSINLYRETAKEDDFIGEGVIFEDGICVLGPSDESESLKYKEINLVNLSEDTGSIFVEMEEHILEDYKGKSEVMNNLKVLQVSFNKFYGHKKEFYIEFLSQNEVIRRSDISRNLLINEVFTFIVDENELVARFRDASLGSDEIIGECSIPKRIMNERMMLNEKDFMVEMQIKVQTANISIKDLYSKGFLKLVINGCNNLKGVDRSGSSDPYVKVFLNSEKIHKTAVKKKELNPVFNESLVVAVNKKTDILRFEVNDWNNIERNTLIAFSEIPLYFLVDGKLDVNLKLTDAKTFKSDAGTINLSFVFSREVSKEDVTKKSGARSLFRL